MKNIKGNLFHTSCNALCITTNGFIKTNGECVMGKGCAAEIAKQIPSIPRHLASLIKLHGNITQIIQVGVPTVLAFPVKPVTTINDGTNVVNHMAHRIPIGGSVPGWAAKANISIIIQSAHELVALADKYNWTDVLIPRPGCGAGELNWSDVEPVLQTILDDRFSAITF